MVLGIAIDLGTANTRVAVFRNDQFEIIPHEGRSSFPSVVAFTERIRLIGEEAKRHGNIQPQNAIYGALDFLGATYHDPLLRPFIQDAPFQITSETLSPETKQTPRFIVSQKGAKTVYSPVEIIAMILRRARKDAESYLGYTVTEAVITLPNYFSYAQQFAVRDAAAIAGLKPLRLIYSSTAALSDLTVSHRIPTTLHNVLVCDVGARHVNITCATTEIGIMESMAISFDFDAGDAYSRRLVRHMISILEKQWPNANGAGILDLRAMNRLRKACEHAKHQLSSMQETVVEIEALYKGRDFKVSITRTRFEELIQDLVRSLIIPIEAALRDAKMDKTDIHDVVLIGGSSRIPKIQQFVSAFFDGKGLLQCLNPEETAVRGAAVQAAILSDDKSSKSINKILQLDVTTKHFGIGTTDGVMKPIVRRATTTPTKKSEMVDEPDRDGNEFVVNIFEGDRARTKDCLKLGQARLPITTTTAPSDAKGVEVEFHFDRHNILSVEVKDNSTGKSETTVIDGHNGGSFDRLSIADRERLKEAEDRMQLEDDAEQQRIEARNTLEELLYSIQGWSNSIDPEWRVGAVSRLGTIVDAILDWLDTNPLFKASEFELRTRELQKLYKESIREQADREQQKKEEDRGRAEQVRTSRKDHINPQIRKMSVDTMQEAMDRLDPFQSSSSTVVENPVERQEKQTGPTGTDETRAFLSPVQDRSVNMTPDSIERSATPRTAQRGLTSLFTISHDSNHTYTDTEFVQISTYLKNTGQPDWSLVPRLYTVLRLIDGLDLLNVFIEQGINDIWFPFEQTTLPRVLSPSVKANFLKLQDVVLSKSLLFERNPERKHIAFQKGEPLPYEVVGKLGAGAHGQVDKVLSTVSHREYARKLFQRMRGMRKDAIRSFLTELQVLKRIQHYHCVELVQSYTDPKFFALIMSPVGDCNLLEYYSIALNDPDKSSLLRSFLGCLANALQYLHGAKIRHRDIKPHNILVKGDRVFLTDFGIALDWEELSRSTTTADSGKTWLYAAPEVVRYEKRNTSADVWSLGCVFMEIVTTLKGQTITTMREFFEQQSGNYRFYANVAHLVSWMDFCRKDAPGKDDVVFDWALSMLEEEAEKRPTAASLHHEISAECTKQGVAFCGTCCREVGESSGIEDGSDDDAWDFDTGEPTVTASRV